VVRELEAFLSSLLASEGDQVLSVVVFGSYARGDFTRHSDVDVLVVLRESSLPFLDRLAELYEHTPRGLIQPLAYTRAEVEKMFEAGNLLVLDALREGVALFDTGFWSELRARLEELIRRGDLVPLDPGWRILRPPGQEPPERVPG